jgi:hypothetical protein
MGSQEQSRLQVLQGLARELGQSEGPSASFLLIEKLWEALKSYPDNAALPDRSKWIMAERYSGDWAYYTPYIQKAYNGMRELGNELDRSTGAHIAESN